MREFKTDSVLAPTVCTLVLAWQALSDAPVVVAANRDEVLDRPASPPGLREGPPRYVAPRDDEAGGTWIGYNEHGLFVGLSNRWSESDLTGERSRGLLVDDLLHAEDADAAAALLETAVAGTVYEPFNVVVADAKQAIVFAWDGVLSLDELTPGVHAVLNAGWDDRFEGSTGREEAVLRQIDSARRLREHLAVRDGETAEDWLGRARVALADHEFGVCVHRDGYGTRSSSLIALYADGGSSYAFADGPPCETAYGPVDGQI